MSEYSAEKDVTRPNDAEGILRDLWAEHTQIRVGGELGMGTPFQEFWCESCRQPYPCKTARTIARYGTLHPEYEFLALRAPVRGEVVDESGRTVSVGGHTWGVNEAIPSATTRIIPPGATDREDRP